MEDKKDVRKMERHNVEASKDNAKKKAAKEEFDKAPQGKTGPDAATELDKAITRFNAAKNLPKDDEKE